MILLIDSGNSRLKAAWLDPGKPGGWREPAIAAFDHREPGALTGWLRDQGITPRRAAGVNVAGAARGEAIAQELRQFHGCPMQWLRAEPRTLMLVNRYTQPEQLGADRWAAMLGIAASLTGPHPPFVLACFGTATTIDIVDSDKVFTGGVILPGPSMMRASLAAGTAGLPLAEGGSVIFPVSTHQAIATGIAAAQAGAVARQWLSAREHSGQTPLLFVTGGGWPAVAAETGRLLAQAGAARGEAALPVHVDSPVLDGLAAWAMASPA
jgi:type III pantothenate kinase